MASGVGVQVRRDGCVDWECGANDGVGGVCDPAVQGARALLSFFGLNYLVHIHARDSRLHALVGACFQWIPGPRYGPIRSAPGPLSPPL